MQGTGTTLARRMASAVLAGTLSLGRLQAQELPTDQQLQTVFGSVYKHLGLMEYCMGKGFADAVDVANTRKSVVATIAGMTVSPAARAQQAVGRHGDIVGPQVIGLMDSTNLARPEEVREGQTMSLADSLTRDVTLLLQLSHAIGDAMDHEAHAIIRRVVERAPAFLKQELLSKEATVRLRAEETLASMIAAALGHS